MPSIVSEGVSVFESVSVFEFVFEGGSRGG
jgi:hypothetical protein